MEKIDGTLTMTSRIGCVICRTPHRRTAKIDVVGDQIGTHDGWAASRDGRVTRFPRRMAPGAGITTEPNNNRVLDCRARCSVLRQTTDWTAAGTYWWVEDVRRVLWQHGCLIKSIVVNDSWLVFHNQSDVLLLQKCISILSTKLKITNVKWLITEIIATTTNATL